MLAHYGVVALPSRVRDPDRKGKVEVGVGHAKRTPLRGLRFEDLDDAQAYLDRWERRWAATRIHGTTERQVAAMFAEEKPALGPLPLEPFRYYQYGHRTVHLDGCVKVASAYYGAPPGWIGRRIHVQWNAGHARLLDPHTGQLLREHLRAPRGWHRIEDRNRPARTPLKTLALLAAAERVGPAISNICDHIHRHDGDAGVRRIRGVLALARKHGPAVAEEAATAALELGVPTYRFLRRYLDRRPVAPLSLRLVDPLTRPFASSASPAWPTSSKRACSKLRPSRWPRSTSSPPSSPTSSTGARTACSPDDTAIQQGYRVIHREAHRLPRGARRADAGRDPQGLPRRADPGSTTSACASYPHTAAEDLLELIMRRYERASTVLTSNRPVEDWGSCSATPPRSRRCSTAITRTC